MKYIICSQCKYIMRIETNGESCIYCGAKLNESEEVTERIWREYWKGVLGRPFQWNSHKDGTQSELF